MDTTRLSNILGRLAGATNNTLYGFAGQAFGELQSIVSVDNRVLHSYLRAMDQWVEWKEKSNCDGSYWQMPSEYSDSKSLSFTLYKWCADGSWGPLNLYLGSGTTFDMAVHEFNHDFLETFTDAIDDIINSENIDDRDREKINIFYPSPHVFFKSNDPFDAEEQSDHSAKLKALESILIGKTNEVLGKLDRHDEALNEIRSHIKSLETSLKTLGRKDWQTMLLGTMLSLSIQKILPSNLDVPALIGW